MAENAYKQAGVDVEAGYESVRLIKDDVKKQLSRVYSVQLVVSEDYLKFQRAMKTPYLYQVQTVSVQK